MRFVELSDAETLLKIMVNFEKVAYIRPYKRSGFGLRKAGTVLYMDNNEFIVVEEEYSTIIDLLGDNVWKS